MINKFLKIKLVICFKLRNKIGMIFLNFFLHSISNFSNFLPIKMSPLMSLNDNCSFSFSFFNLSFLPRSFFFYIQHSGRSFGRTFFFLDLLIQYQSFWSWLLFYRLVVILILFRFQWWVLTFFLVVKVENILIFRFIWF